MYRLKCHFHLVSMLNSDSYKIIDKLPLNIEIRKYDASVWSFTKANTENSEVEYPTYVCQQLHFLFKILFDASEKYGQPLDDVFKDYIEFTSKRFPIDFVSFKIIPEMTVAVIKLENTRGRDISTGEYLKYRQLITQELENLNELKNYDLENLFSVERNKLKMYFSNHEVWVRKIT